MADVSLRVLAVVVWPAVVLVIAVVAMLMFRKSISGLLQKANKLEVWKLKIESLEQYVGPATIAELKKNPEPLQLEATSRQVTVLYARLRGLTTISEQSSEWVQRMKPRVSLTGN